MGESLDEIAGGPDFTFPSLPQFAPGKSYNPRYDYFHRRTPEAEIYFIANPRDEVLESTASFRVTGRKPELWDPVTGERRMLPECREEKGHTLVPMHLAFTAKLFCHLPQRGARFQRAQ